MDLGVFIQLNPVGSSVGPLVDLFSDVDGYTTPFATGVTVSSLIDGYWFNNVPLGTNNIKITSYGDCTNSIILPIENLPGCDDTYCDEFCCQYELSNNSGGLRSWSYYDCEGTPVSGIYDNGDSLRFCADKSIGAILVDSGCTLTRLGCCYDCYCFTLTGNVPFTVQYIDCLGVEQTLIATYIGIEYVAEYCGGFPTVVSGSFTNQVISGLCYWDYINYVCV